MRSKSQKTMDEIVKIIEEFRMERGETPSLAQIAEKVHLSRSSVYYYLRDRLHDGVYELYAENTGRTYKANRPKYINKRQEVRNTDLLSVYSDN